MRERPVVDWPNGKRKRVPRSTLHRWISDFRKDSYPGLLPQQRSDAGKPRDDYTHYVDYAIGLLLEQPERSLNQLEVYLKGKFDGQSIPRATLHRQLLVHPAYPVVEQLRTGKEKQLYGRYEAGRVHECWQLDGKGPFRVKFTSGEVVQVKVLSVLDDRSRSILAAVVAPSESAVAAITVFQKAALRYGLPERMQFDRGSAFDSQEFRGGIAQCGVHRNFVCAKQPTAQGKIESYNRVLDRWFIQELKAQEVVDHEHLQQLLDAMIAVVYQQHRHRVIGCTPNDRLNGQVSARRLSESDLARAFFVETTKTSHTKTGEVQLENGCFRVPVTHAGKRATFRYDPLRPQAVLVTPDGRELPLQPFVTQPLPPPIVDKSDEKRGQGQLQKLVDKWRGTPRPNAEPAFGLPEVFATLAALVGRRVPEGEADAKLVVAFYRQHGPLARAPWLLACERTKQALGDGRALDVYLKDLERQIPKPHDGEGEGAQ